MDRDAEYIPDFSHKLNCCHMASVKPDQEKPVLFVPLDSPVGKRLRGTLQLTTDSKEYVITTPNGYQYRESYEDFPQMICNAYLVL